MQIGSGSGAGIKTESTWGTPVTAGAVFLAITRFSVGAKRQKMRPGHLMPAAGVTTHRTPMDVVTVGVSASGDVEFVPKYNDKAWTTMLRHMMHNAAVTTGAGPYLHTFTIADSRPGLTLQKLDGSGPLTNNARIVSGAVVSAWEMSISARNFLRVKASFVARDVADPTAYSGTPLATNEEEIQASHGASTGFSWQSTNFRHTDVTVKCDHKIVETPFVGSLFTAQPTYGDHAEIRVTAKVYVEGNEALTLFRSDARGDLVITLTGTSPNAMQITAQEAVLASCELATDGAGLLYYQCEWMVSAAAGKTGLTVLVTNSQSTAE